MFQKRLDNFIKKTAKNIKFGQVRWKIDLSSVDLRFNSLISYIKTKLL
jgi:hypothetical protein